MCRGAPLDERQSAAELEAVMQHHHNLQEKLAEDMLNLARNLKNNTLAAQNIIKQDNQVTGRLHTSCTTVSIILFVVLLLFLHHQNYCTFTCQECISACFQHCFM